MKTDQTSLTISTRLTIVLTPEDAARMSKGPAQAHDVLQPYITVARRRMDRQTDIVMPDGTVVYSVNIQ